jgi:hypothetical protein
VSLREALKTALGRRSSSSLFLVMSMPIMFPSQPLPVHFSSKSLALSDGKGRQRNGNAGCCVDIGSCVLRTEHGSYTGRCGKN